MLDDTKNTRSADDHDDDNSSVYYLGYTHAGDNNSHASRTYGVQKTGYTVGKWLAIYTERIRLLLWQLSVSPGQGYCRTNLCVVQGKDSAYLQPDEVVHTYY